MDTLKLLASFAVELRCSNQPAEAKMHAAITLVRALNNLGVVFDRSHFLTACGF